MKTQGSELPSDSMADFPLNSLDTQWRPNVEYRKEMIEKDSCSQMHSASVKFVPVTEFINETSIRTQYNCDEFRFWWENPKNYFYFKTEKTASFLKIHSTGQSLVPLESALFQTSPQSIPTASAFSGACWGDPGTCHDLQPTSSFHQR